MRQRESHVIAGLRTLVKSRQELATGFSYEFGGTDENLDKLMDFIKTERRCCDFFTFELIVEEDRASLKITGPEGAKAFLEESVGL